MAEVTPNLKSIAQRMDKVVGKILRFEATIETYRDMRVNQEKSGFNLESIDNTINCYIDSVSEQAFIMSELVDQLKGNL